MRTIPILTALAAVLLLTACSRYSADTSQIKTPTPTVTSTQAPTMTDTTPQTAGDADPVEKLTLTENEWRDRLTAEQYRVLREKGTERAFTSPLLKIKDPGTFLCAGCDLPLFDAKTKFTSGTGWPSFYQPIAPTHILEHKDTAYGMVRTEVVCARCDGHLGHVFPDGPKPTGLRYCINGVSLTFSPTEDAKAE